MRLRFKFKWTRRRMIALLAAAVLFGILAGCGVLSDAGRVCCFACRAIRGTPAVVTLSGDPAEAGRIHGSEQKLGIRLLEKYYIGSFAGGEAGTELFRRATELFERISPRWNMEVEALAEASGARPETMKLGNCFLDLGRLRMGCRQVLRTLPAGGVLHAHNLDWDGLAGVGQYWVTIFRVPGGGGRLPTVYLGFSGMIGALDVINSEGIALSFNQLGHSSGETEMPVFLRMREIAETARDFDSAESAILSMPFTIGLSHAKSGRIAVYERTPDGTVRKREAVDGMITADNTAQAGNAVHDTGVERTARAALPLDTPAAMMDVLRNTHVLLANNMYSVIFDFSANVLYLASGEVPAANGEYRVYPLFE